MADDTIGERIRFYRHRMSMSQAELAKRSGVSVSSISRYEKGRTSPSLDQTRLIADVFGVSLSMMIMKLEEPDGNDSEPLII